MRNPIQSDFSQTVKDCLKDEVGGWIRIQEFDFLLQGVDEDTEGRYMYNNIYLGSRGTEYVQVGMVAEKQNTRNGLSEICTNKLIN